MEIILTQRHPANNDKSAVIVFEEQKSGICVYRVAGGFIATNFKLGECLASIFQSKKEAIELAFSAWA
jgi:hypothetical protein